MKFLVIRFSSIGDLTQSLSIAGLIKYYVPEAEIHFVTRQDLAVITENNPHIHKVWKLDRQTGLRGLFSLISELRQQNFTHIYDAHNNLRSFFIRQLVGAEKKLTRPMMRFKRFLLLNFRYNLFEQPFSGQRDLLKPLEKWGFRFFLPAPPQLFLDHRPRRAAASLLPAEPFVALAPSAAYELKRWPLENWLELVRRHPQTRFVVLAGAQDHFTAAFNHEPNVLNLTGKTDLGVSAAVIEKAMALVTNDTGLLHFAEQLGVKAVALMGPAPFGFPSRQQTIILQKDLPSVL
jgi:ADP-heptose:LPS heptosyltransferase